MMGQMELNNPGQAEVAAYVNGKFGTAGEEDEEGDVGDDGGETPSDGLNANSGFPRTPQQQRDYDRQIKAYRVNAKLLNTQAVEKLERPKYLSRRLVSRIFCDDI